VHTVHTGMAWHDILLYSTYLAGRGGSIRRIDYYGILLTVQEDVLMTNGQILTLDDTVVRIIVNNKTAAPYGLGSK